MNTTMPSTHSGEKSPTAKLTAEQVTEIIRRNLAGERHTPLAQQFGVSVATIGKLVRGDRWREIPGERRIKSRREGVNNHLAKLNEIKVRDIRRDREQGMTYRLLAQKYQVHQGTILAIIQRRTWKAVV